MTPGQYVFLMAAIAAVLLLLMWWGWRGRVKRDVNAVDLGAEMTGPVHETIDTAMYVSTTPVGRPFERIAIPGLSYRGAATVEFFQDGVRIAVRGEPAVSIAADHVVGAGEAAARAGKAVERGGLSLLVWRGERDDLIESTFRFPDARTRLRFEVAVERLIEAADGPTLTTSPYSHPIQEDA